MEGGAYVADLEKLVPEPGLAQQLRIVAELRALGAARQRRERGFGRDHARLHRRVRALDLGHVEETRRVPDQRPTREHQLRDRLEAPFRQGPGTVGDPPPTLEYRADRRMGLVALHLLEGR